MIANFTFPHKDEEYKHPESHVGKVYYDPVPVRTSGCEADHLNSPVDSHHDE